MHYISVSVVSQSHLDTLAANLLGHRLCNNAVNDLIKRALVSVRECYIDIGTIITIME